MVTRIKNNAVTTSTTTSNANAELAEMVRKLQAENEALKLKASKQGAGQTSLKVSESGCVSMYGLGRYPTTLRALTKEGVWEGSQWEKVCSITGGNGGKLKEFVQANLAAIKAATAKHNALKAAKGEASEDAL